MRMLVINTGLTSYYPIPLVANSTSRVRNTTFITTLDTMITIRWVSISLFMMLLHYCLAVLLRCCYCVDSTNTNSCPSWLVSLFLFVPITNEKQSSNKYPTNNKTTTNYQRRVAFWSSYPHLLPLSLRRGGRGRNQLPRSRHSRHTEKGDWQPAEFFLVIAPNNPCLCSLTYYFSIPWHTLSSPHWFIDWFPRSFDLITAPGSSSIVAECVGQQLARNGWSHHARGQTCHQGSPLPPPPSIIKWALFHPHILSLPHPLHYCYYTLSHSTTLPLSLAHIGT